MLAPRTFRDLHRRNEKTLEILGCPSPLPRTNERLEIELANGAKLAELWVILNPADRMEREGPRSRGGEDARVT